MKRMNVREFRAKVSELHQEPIEVVRYHETVGYWIPIEMTTEPPVAKRPAVKITSSMSTKEMEVVMKKVRAKMEALMKESAEMSAAIAKTR